MRVVGVWLIPGRDAEIAHVLNRIRRPAPLLPVYRRQDHLDGREVLVRPSRLDDLPVGARGFTLFLERHGRVGCDRFDITVLCVACLECLGLARK